MSHSSSAFSRWFSHYGMAGVLVLLCLYYSWATYAEQQPIGAAAATVLADQLDRTTIGTVLIVAKPTEEDIAFIQTLDARLQAAGFTIAGKVQGDPRAARQALQQLADANIPLQIKKYYLELKEAENSTTATKGAYTNSKKWAVTALANFDFGVGPAKEIFEALQAYARMRAAYFQSLYNYRMAWANLDYATGESPLENTK